MKGAFQNLGGDVYIESIVLGLTAVAVLAVWRKSRRHTQHEPPASTPIASPSVPSVAGLPLESSSKSDKPETWLGRTVGGHRLVEVLGQGGMANVFKARSKDGSQDLAIKVIRSEFLTEEAFRRRFDRETEICKDLKHPHIVQLKDWGEDSGGLFLALEFVGGGTLKDRLLPEGLPLETVVALVTEMIDGLCYAHARGIVHRDLKPENIMLSSDGAIKIADFGLARAEGRDKITKTGDSMGTPAYFPPEQITGAEPTAAADQYSMGVMLYEMLTGVRPFQEPNPLKMLMQHLSEAPPSPLNYKPDLHPTLAVLVLRMLEKKPEARFPELAMVSEGLKAIASGQDWQMPSPIETPAVAPAISINLSQSPVSDSDEDGTVGFAFQRCSEDQEASLD